MTPPRPTLEHRISAIFGLDDDGWARHANPWSGWTRFATTLPLLIAAIWSRVWLGWWSLIPVALALLWIWINPRVFDPAVDDRAWISRGVFGERLWTRRRDGSIPPRHRRIPHLLNLATAAGIPFIVWGLVGLRIWPTLTGFIIIVCFKLWYIDRMVVLYEDVVAGDPTQRYPWVDFDAERD